MEIQHVVKSEAGVVCDDHVAFRLEVDHRLKFVLTLVDRDVGDSTGGRVQVDTA